MAAPDPNEPLYLVDGTAQLFRAYFALGGLTNDDGLPTGAVFGFTTMLRKLIKDEGITHIAVAFDLPGEVFRNEQYADYKANRPPTPEDLNVQMPYAKQACEVLGVPVLEEEGFEADDLIATYARRAREEGREVVIVASDKDLLQLVGEGVSVLNPSKNVRLDAEGVAASFGVPPGRVLDVLGMMGDAVDNIPGVPGVGQKTALAMVAAYGDIEAIIARAGRFVACYDARDALVEAIDTAGRAETFDGDVASILSAAVNEMRGRLSELVQAEADPVERDRLEPVAAELASVDVAALPAGEPGRKAVKPLAALKRALKGMDKGSSKRVWYSVDRHVDQARMSKELATLHLDAPMRVAPPTLRLGAPDRGRAHALFESLGFRGLTAEFEGEAAEQGASDAAGDKPELQYETVLEASALEAVAARCREAGRIAVDTETDGRDPMAVRLVGLSICWQAGHAAYVPLGHDYLGAPDQLSLDAVRAALGPLLADPVVAKVGQNFKYDAHVLRRHGLPVEGWALDTMVAAFLLNSGRSTYAIDSLAKEYLGQTTTPYAEIAGSGAKQRTLNEIDVERVAGYAAEDVDVALRLDGMLVSRLREASLVELYTTIDGPLLPVLIEMEAAGIRVDVAALETMSREMDGGLSRARDKVYELAGGEFNLDSPKQLREILFDKLGLKSRRRTAKSRAASTDAQTLEELREAHPIAEEILSYRELSKLKSTYVDALPRLVNAETGRVHTCYHPTGAATGRLSSSDPNLQNIPARTEAGLRIRSAFVPDEGYTFLACDYSQIELRVLAHLTEDPELVAAFRAGEDIHRHTASRVFDVNADLVTDAMRRSAKAVNFGILYGMSETRLAREQGMSRADARRFIGAYFERFGRVREYIDQVRDSARREGAVRTLFGRVRLFPQLHQKINRAVQEQALRAAVNTTVQGTAADLMKLAMLEVRDRLRAARSGARMLLQVHDELLLEVPEGSEEQVGRLVGAAMAEVHPLRVPLVVDQKSGKNWLEAT